MRTRKEDVPGRADGARPTTRREGRPDESGGSRRSGTGVPQKLRVGVVGCGSRGAEHVRALTGLPWVCSVTAIDPDPQKRSYVARRFSWVGEAAELEEVLDEFDAVVIATPVDARARLAVDSFDAGKHVLVEAPVATAPEVARQLQEDAAQRGVVFATSYANSAHDNWERIRGIVAGGRLGRIHYVDAVYEGFGRYRSGLNVLWDLGPRPVAMVNHALGAEPSRVTGWGRTLAHRDAHDFVDVTFEYGELDVPFHVRLSWLSPARSRRLTFVGSRAMLVYEVAQGRPTLIFHDKHVVVDTTGSRLTEDMRFIHRRGRAEPLDLPSTDVVAACDKGFVEAIQGIRQLPIQLRNGSAVVYALAAAQNSIDETGLTEVSVKRSRMLDGVPA